MRNMGPRGSTLMINLPSITTRPWRYSAEAQSQYLLTAWLTIRFCSRQPQQGACGLLEGPVLVEALLPVIGYESSKKPVAIFLPGELKITNDRRYT